MNVRNVQRTGSMFYIYLPTGWCRKYRILAASKVAMETNNDGSLTIIPEVKERVQKRISIAIDEKNEDVLIMLIMACFINPVHSFRIELKGDVDITRILDRKNFVAGFEFVDLDRNVVTYQAAITVNDPDLLLRSMAKRLRGMIEIALTGTAPEAIAKYEEEIDRSKLLINKAVLAGLTHHDQARLRPIELHYVSLISVYLERIADVIIRMKPSEQPYLKMVLEVVELIRAALDDAGGISYASAIDIAKKALKLKEKKMESIAAYNIALIRNNLINVSEILLDWSMTLQMDEGEGKASARTNAPASHRSSY
ncbi:TPA: hypothetical protein HA361_02305 [Candidatus Woesearchaeota archaeon]|nr:hypothetical protein [Candidatus Woesearchaeota archaeon]